MRALLVTVTGIILGALAFATPVQAAVPVLDTSACISVADPHGCLFGGNITTATSGNSSYLLAQADYNLFNDTHPTAQPDIFLSPLFNSNDVGFPGTVTGSTSGSWSLPGFLVNFFAVKAADNFVLYEITPASSGLWNTFDIPFNTEPHGISHMVFFGDPVSGVPEPATWALFIIGFGAVGGTLRTARRRAALAAV